MCTVAKLRQTLILGMEKRTRLTEHPHTHAHIHTHLILNVQADWWVSTQVQLHMLLHMITHGHTWFQLDQYTDSVPSVGFTTSFLPPGSGIMDNLNGPSIIPVFYMVAVSILPYQGVFSTRVLTLYTTKT